VVQPIPDPLVARPWRLGAPPERVIRAVAGARGPLWTRPHRGVLAWSALDPSATSFRVLAAAEAEPGVPLGTWAAAWMHGAQDLDGEWATGVPQDVVFCPGRSGRRMARPGLRPLRSELDDEDVVVVRGIPVTSPVRTAFDLGRTAPNLDTAVADVDCLLRHTRVAVPALAAYTARRPGWKGVPLLRAALPLLDPRSRSRPESRMRVVWVRDAGLPLPLCNAEVRSRQGRRLLGIPDLLDPASGLVGEYDGGYHRDPDQHGADNVREERLEEHGLVVVRATWRQVIEPSALAQRLRAGYSLAQRTSTRRWYVPPSRRS